jgi:DeoR/GlpR family transcriptional regulator of sugar metabolism
MITELSLAEQLHDFVDENSPASLRLILESANTWLSKQTVRSVLDEMEEQGFIIKVGDRWATPSYLRQRWFPHSKGITITDDLYWILFEKASAKHLTINQYFRRLTGQDP